MKNYNFGSFLFIILTIISGLGADNAISNLGYHI